MPSHWLRLQGSRAGAEWLLDWDDARFLVRSPDGLHDLETDTRHAHRLIEIYGLYWANRICFGTASGWLMFKYNRDAADDLRAMLESGLRSDLDYRRQIGEDARRAVVRGLWMFVAGSIPFALYCWFAAWAERPAPGDWADQFIQRFGWAIHAALLGLLCVAVHGVLVFSYGRVQRSLVRRVECTLNTTDSQN